MDFKTMGTAYTILDYDDGKLKKIFVVDSDDLFELTKGLKGREHQESTVRCQWHRIYPTVRHPWDVTWYTASERDFSLEVAMAVATRQGNHVVVVEIISEN